MLFCSLTRVINFDVKLPKFSPTKIKGSLPDLIMGILSVISFL